MTSQPIRKNNNSAQRYSASNALLERAERVIPLGSQTFSKSRIQFPVPFAPLYLERGKGGRVWDVDGNEYVDLICGLLPVVLGYGDPDVNAAITRQLEKGISFSLATELEIELAERLTEIIPCAEMVRFGKNGTDATSAAIRLARAFTGRDHVLALGYHGWQDWYIGATTRNLGVPEAVRKLTCRLPFNDLKALQDAFAARKGHVAAIILEPLSSSEPDQGYLKAVQALCREEGAILVFDEIVTGFRIHAGGAQAHYGVKPDLAAFGKAMANGMPISAIVGRADIMSLMEKIFYSGTFGGETLSLAASIATIDKIRREPVIETLWKTGDDLARKTEALIRKYNLDGNINLAGVAPWKIFVFTDHPAAPKEAIKTRFLIEALRGGVLTGASHNICYAHTPNDINYVLRAYDAAFARIADDLRDRKLLKRLEAPPIYPVFQVRG